MKDTISIFVVVVHYDFDQGFNWDSNNITLIAENDKDAIEKANNICLQKNKNRKDLEITDTVIKSILSISDVMKNGGLIKFS